MPRVAPTIAQEDILRWLYKKCTKKVRVLRSLMVSTRNYPTSRGNELLYTFRDVHLHLLRDNT